MVYSNHVTKPFEINQNLFSIRFVFAKLVAETPVCRQAGATSHTQNRWH